MILQSHFYHKTIKIYTAVFGKCFSSLQVERDDGKLISVPIAYAAKQKYNVIEQQGADDDLIKFNKRTPRISFLLTSLNRDASRVKNKQFQLKHITTDTGVAAQYNRVPYIFNFKLDITTKYMDDMLQLIEQICVSFNPSLQIVIKDNPDLEEDSAISITLLSPSIEDNFEGIYDNGREITFSADFQLDGYLYMPTNDGNIIRTVYVNYNDLDTMELLDKATYHEEDALSAEEKAAYEYRYR